MLNRHLKENFIVFERNVFYRNIQNRKSINNGELISNENKKLGTFHFPKKIGDWDMEEQRIKNAKRKAGIT